MATFVNNQLLINKVGIGSTLTTCALLIAVFTKNRSKALTTSRVVKSSLVSPD